jgi:hypothetical protein
MVFLLIQQSNRAEIPDVELEVAKRPKNIRIHLALSRVRLLSVTFQFIWKFLRRRLYLSHSTVHKELDTRYITAVLRGQEEHGLCNLFGTSQTT